MHSWLAALKSDLQWLYCQRNVPPSYIFASVSEWWDLFSTQPTKANQRLVSVMKSVSANQHGVWVVTSTEIQLATLWQCQHCSRTFITKHARAAHYCKVHHVNRAIRYYVDGTLCVW